MQQHEHALLRARLPICSPHAHPSSNPGDLGRDKVRINVNIDQEEPKAIHVPPSALVPWISAGRETERTQPVARPRPPPDRHAPQMQPFDAITSPVVKDLVSERGGRFFEAAHGAAIGTYVVARAPRGCCWRRMARSKAQMHPSNERVEVRLVRRPVVRAGAIFENGQLLASVSY